MIKWINFFALMIFWIMALGQDQEKYLTGTVENESTGFPMESVHIINLNLVEGTTTDKKGNFDAKFFEQKSKKEQVKMIEIKLSQGAKPGHGGMLLAPKVTHEIAKTRGITMNQDCISPA